MKRLKELREKHNITQSELAKHLHCSNNTISRYELGDREPDFETTQIIADYFDVSIDYLIGRSDFSTGQNGQKKEASPDDPEMLLKNGLTEIFGHEPTAADLRFILQAYKAYRESKKFDD